MPGTDKKPLISVVTVVFNAAETIEETVQSVLNQNFDNFEYLIVDGASSDGTLEKIEKYRNRLTLISEYDTGIYDAMNKAVKLTKGSYVYFIGADDIFKSANVLREVAEKLKSRNTVYYGDVLFKHKGNVYDGNFGKVKLATRNICHQSIFYPADVFLEYFFDTEYRIFADYYLNILLFYRSAFSFQYIDLVIAVYNDKGQSGLDVLDKNFERDRLKIFYKNSPKYLIRRIYKTNKLCHPFRANKHFFTTC